MPIFFDNLDKDKYENTLKIQVLTSSFHANFDSKQLDKMIRAFKIDIKKHINDISDKYDHISNTSGLSS